MGGGGFHILGYFYGGGFHILGYFMGGAFLFYGRQLPFLARSGDMRISCKEVVWYPQENMIWVGRGIKPGKSPSCVRALKRGRKFYLVGGRGNVWNALLSSSTSLCSAATVHVVSISLQAHNSSDCEMHPVVCERCQEEVAHRNQVYM